MDTLIDVEHATVRRQGKDILEDCSIRINAGEHIAILGPNGAGKSTLLQICSMEIHPLWTENLKVMRFGETRINQEILRQHLGCVSSTIMSMCNTTYTAREVVAGGLLSSFGLDFHHHLTDEMWQAVDNALEENDCGKLASQYMNRLSSGEAQRVLLARALVHDPQLLLLDEAANGLDFPSRALYRKALAQTIEKGKTIVMVTHELSQILPQINRIILMAGGRIVADGTKKELLNEGILSKLYGQQVFVAERNGLYSAWC
ncbi:MAG: ATP-binding cassette domain-containing protein [Spirochaetia bacterium]|jgi:iron complex transport system ATP-binding protein|nr:ATP-binding cassette domain-containing protein [Spirochaetia bacterium]